MSRAKFKKELTIKLAEIGYEKYPTRNEFLFFVKPIGNNFYNIIISHFSRFDHSSFTGEFFLSLYPSDIYEEHGERRVYRNRIGYFLEQEERVKLLNNDKENVSGGRGDAWWYTTDPNCIDHFIQAVTYAEPRFLAQENIYQQVLDNERLRWFYNKDIREIIRLASSKELEGKEYNLIPKTDPDKIGMHWFKAAEIFIKEYSTLKYHPQKAALKKLASEAYMTDKYEKIYGPYNPILLELKQKSYDEFFNKKNPT